jgi:hypothetical protein
MRPKRLVLANAGSGHNRGWRRAVVANDGDMPNIGISIKIERWTRMVARYEALRAMDVQIESALV